MFGKKKLRERIEKLEAKNKKLRGENARMMETTNELMRQLVALGFVKVKEGKRGWKVNLQDANGKALFLGTQVFSTSKEALASVSGSSSSDAETDNSASDMPKGSS